MDFIVPLFGRFHPILVHLPIGILVFGTILVFLSKPGKTLHIDSIRLAFLLGGVAAVFSSISGFLQYQFEGFDWSTVQFHFILALITTATSFRLWFQLSKSKNLPAYFKIKSTFLVILLVVTGHLGGNITHGEAYFTEILPPGLQAFLGIEIEPEKGPQLEESSWENAELFTEVIQPILNQNCKSCHNPRNSKGELDLSTMKGILAGGKEGLILKAGDAEHSELFSRLILEKEDDDHMPPAEKRQPSKEEIALIESWIKSGGKEKGTLAEAKIPQKLIEEFIIRNEIPFYPEVELAEISPDSISALKKMGFFVEPVHLGSPLLKVSCLNFPDFEDADLSKLFSLGGNLAYLDLNDTQISGEILSKIAAFPNLTVIKLNGTLIEGKDLTALQQCLNLKHLYLNGVIINPEDLPALESLPALEKVYAYGTALSGNPAVRKFRFSLETGGYLLPAIPSDTIVY